MNYSCLTVTVHTSLKSSVPWTKFVIFQSNPDRYPPHQSTNDWFRTTHVLKITVYGGIYEYLMTSDKFDSNIGSHVLNWNAEGKYSTTVKRGICDRFGNDIGPSWNFSLLSTRDVVDWLTIWDVNTLFEVDYIPNGWSLALTHGSYSDDIYSVVPIKLGFGSSGHNRYACPGGCLW